MHPRPHTNTRRRKKNNWRRAKRGENRRALERDGACKLQGAAFNLWECVCVSVWSGARSRRRCRHRHRRRRRPTQQNFMNGICKFYFHLQRFVFFCCFCCCSANHVESNRDRWRPIQSPYRASGADNNNDVACCFNLLCSTLAYPCLISAPYFYPFRRVKRVLWSLKNFAYLWQAWRSSSSSACAGGL